jgi:large subunit ribosomal protein L25
MASTITLTGTPRTQKGKGAARKMRAENRIPGVVYGPGADPILIEISEREFVRTVTGHSVSNMILDLSVGGETIKALIREIQSDPLTQQILHVDLHRISMTEKIEVEVPLELLGVPIGVKDFGGVLAHPNRTLTVLCLAVDVPVNIEVDITALNIGDSIHVNDLDVGDLEIVSDPEMVVASVSAPRVEDEPVAEVVEGEAAAAGETPEGAEAREKEEEKGKGKGKEGE